MNPEKPNVVRRLAESGSLPCYREGPVSGDHATTEGGGPQVLLATLCGGDRIWTVPRDSGAG